MARQYRIIYGYMQSTKLFNSLLHHVLAIIGNRGIGSYENGITSLFFNFCNSYLTVFFINIRYNNFRAF